MSILKFENRTPRSLEEMHQYLTNPAKTDACGVIGLGVNPFNPVAEMRFVQSLYYKENLSHDYLQVIFAFDVGVKIDIVTLREICMRLAEVLIIDRRQVFGAIHYLNTDKIHCHYIINYVSIDGDLYQQGRSVQFYKKRINEILSDYGLQPIHFNFEQIRSDSNE